MHNALLYHCLKCGSVAHIDLDAEAPRCCGREMAKAGAETICDGEDESQGARSDPDMAGAIAR
jgi:hypothetical protein